MLYKLLCDSVTKQDETHSFSFLGRADGLHRRARIVPTSLVCSCFLPRLFYCVFQLRRDVGCRAHTVTAKAFQSSSSLITMATSEHYHKQLMFPHDWHLAWSRGSNSGVRIQRNHDGRVRGEGSLRHQWFQQNGDLWKSRPQVRPMHRYLQGKNIVSAHQLQEGLIKRRSQIVS